MQKQVLLKKRLEKAQRKVFALNCPFPTFTLHSYHREEEGDGGAMLLLETVKRPKLTLYGEINEQELFVSSQKKEEQTIVLDEQERVKMEQVVTNVIETKAHMEQFNRFQDLQT